MDFVKEISKGMLKAEKPEIKIGSTVRVPIIARS